MVQFENNAEFSNLDVAELVNEKLAMLSEGEARSITFRNDLTRTADANPGEPEPNWISSDDPENTFTISNNRNEVQHIFAGWVSDMIKGNRYIDDNQKFSKEIKQVRDNLADTVGTTDLKCLFDISANKDVKLKLTQETIEEAIKNLRSNSPLINTVLSLYKSSTLAKRITHNDPLLFDAFLVVWKQEVKISRDDLKTYFVWMIKNVSTNLENKWYKIYWNMEEQVNEFFS